MFWATAGGMGLTGVIARGDAAACCASRRLVHARGHRARRRPRRPDGAHGRAATTRYRYSVAWIDCLARGASWAARCSCRGDHAALRRAAARQRERPLRPPPPAAAARRPPWAPAGPAATAPPCGAFNELWFRKAPRERARPARALAVLPPARRRAGLEPALRAPRLPPVPVRRALRRGGRAARARSSASAAPARLVPRRAQALRARARAALVPDAGLDARPRHPRRLRRAWPPLLDEPRRPGGRAGGRVYLAKDSRLRPELLRAMYPRLDEWRARPRAARPRAA